MSGRRGAMSEAEAAELSAPFTEQAVARLRELAEGLPDPGDAVRGQW
jgi:hypothetical protein